MIMGRTVLASNESLSPTHPFTLNMVRNEYQAEAAEGKQLHFRRCTGHALRSTDCSILTYTTDLSFYLTQGSTLLYVAFSSKTDLLDEMQGCRLRSPLPPVITRFCNRPLRCFVNFPWWQHLWNAPFDAPLQLSRTHCQKLFSIMTPLQFLNLG